MVIISKKLLGCDHHYFFSSSEFSLSNRRSLFSFSIYISAILLHCSILKLCVHTSFQPRSRFLAPIIRTVAPPTTAAPTPVPKSAVTPSLINNYSETNTAVPPTTPPDVPAPNVVKKNFFILLEYFWFILSSSLLKYSVSSYRVTNPCFCLSIRLNHSVNLPSWIWACSFFKTN